MKDLKDWETGHDLRIWRYGLFSQELEDILLLERRMMQRFACICIAEVWKDCFGISCDLSGLKLASLGEAVDAYHQRVQEVYARHGATVHMYINLQEIISKTSKSR